MDFESTLRDQLAMLSRELKTNVVIDDIDLLPSENANVLLVAFHLEGKDMTPAQFTFPFSESLLRENIESLRDFIQLNWKTAHLPPPVARMFNASSGTAGSSF